MKPTGTATRSIARRHDWVDERSRALHALIAEKIRRDPKLLEIPRQNLNRWLHSASEAAQPALQAWQTMIENRPVEELLEFLAEASERADQLRQSSPFTGILNQSERNEIFARYEAL